jgi:putative peptidoglycan lipid II flippase
MIKKFVKKALFHDKPTDSVAAAALVISLFGIASRVLGLVRDRILASQFGAGDMLDAYYAAFRIPDFIFNIMIAGALSAAFIPVFTEFLTKKKQEDAWKLCSGVLSLQIYATSIISIFFIIFASQFMHLLTPGYSGAKMDLTVLMTRIMFLSSFLFGISGIISGVLMSFKKFLIYSLAPIFYNIGIIIGAVYFVKWWGPVGLAWGVVLGAFMHMSVQYPSVRISGFVFRPMFMDAFKNPGVLKVLKLMVPRTLAVGVSQINFMIITNLASTLAGGSLAVFSFASNLQSAPLGLFGVSFSIAVFPTLSAYAAKNETGNFIEAFSRTFRQILFFVIPSSIFLIVLRAQIVRVLLGTGKFGWNDTILTFQTLGILSIGLFAQALLPLLTRAFYALQNTKTPLYIGLFSEGVTLFTALMLIKQYGIFGLAIAFSFSSIINLILLLIFLRKKLPSIDGKKILISTGKILIASLAAGIIAQVAKILIGTQGELDTFMAVLTQLVIAGLLGGATFMLVSYFLKSEEYFQFMRSITKRIFKEKKIIEENIHEVTGA